ncbi:MAG: hypothetical protein BHV68_19545 [Bacteroidales bacterium 43_8]|nr:MAG: hypothetical protein BHV68_19545 [Bacteroidales bacterium 43_8]
MIRKLIIDLIRLKFHIRYFIPIKISLFRYLYKHKKKKIFPNGHFVSMDIPTPYMTIVSQNIDYGQKCTLI